LKNECRGKKKRRKGAENTETADWGLRGKKSHRWKGRLCKRLIKPLIGEIITLRKTLGAVRSDLSLKFV